MRFTWKMIDAKVQWALAIVLFLAFSAVHVVCGDFPKTIDVMPDEMRYLDTARSLFSGEGLIMRGDASSFQKILYPLSLFPALFFPDGQEQVRVMNILNSLYACSAVFPALLLARRLFSHPAPIIACIGFTLVLPDLMYSMTFMTESVFIPITLWLILLCWHCFGSSGRRELVLAGGAGLLCYAVYLCKEVAWMFVIAFVLWYIVAIVRKNRERNQGIMAIGLFLIGYLAPFVIMKLTLFSGLMNSYSQFSFDILLSPYTVLFGLYSVATDATYFIVGFGVFPVLYLALVYRNMPREQRDLYFFCITSLAIGLAVVVFTISMREDVGHVTLRQHLRYVIPLYLPLLMLFIKQVAHFDPTPIVYSPRRRGIAVGLTVGFCMLVVTFFGSANLRQGFDNSEFHLMRWILSMGEALPTEFYDGWASTITAIAEDDGDLLVIEPLNWLCRALVVVYAAVGMRLLLSLNRDVRLDAGTAICSMLAALMVANSLVAFEYNRGAYGAEQADIDEICAVYDQLQTRDAEGQVVIVLDNGNTKSNNLVDTYIQDGVGEYRYIKLENLADELNSDTQGLSAVVDERIAYLLVNEKQDITFVSGDVVQVGGTANDDGRFYLYQVMGDERPKVLVTEEE